MHGRLQNEGVYHISVFVPCLSSALRMLKCLENILIWFSSVILAIFGIKKTASILKIFTNVHTIARAIYCLDDEENMYFTNPSNAVVIKMQPWNKSFLQLKTVFKPRMHLVHHKFLQCISRNHSTRCPPCMLSPRLNTACKPYSGT